MKIKSESFGKKNSPLDYFDLQTIQKGSFPNLKPSLKTISIRIPQDMLDALKILANKKDVPYQSLAKIYLAKQIKQERPFFHDSKTSLKKPISKGFPKGSAHD